MKKFYFAFKNEDVLSFKDRLDANSVLVGFSDLTADVFFNVSSVEVNHNRLLKIIDDLFQADSKLIDESFYSFKNNFYECTLLPLAKIITFLEDNVKSGSDKIVFANKMYLNSADGPSYYMGEHESHRIFFYERACSFQPYIERYLKSNLIEFEYVDSKYSFNWIKNLVRDSVVLTALTYISIRNSFKRSKNNRITAAANSKNALVLVRTRAQLDFLYELLLATKMNVTLLVLPSSTSDLSLFDICLDRFKNSSHITISRENGFLKDLVTSIFNTLFLYIKIYFKPNFNKKNVTLENMVFKRAFCEMTLIRFSIILYDKILANFLDNNGHCYDVLFTCEQKSPQAYIDSFNARKYGLKSVQLMTCDQSEDIIPNPVPSDLLVVDTRKTEDMFRKSWLPVANEHKIKFLGSIKSLQLKRVSYDYKKFSYDFCYFCHLTEVEQNLKIIEILDKHCAEYAKRFCIKVHPRDDKRWLARVTINNGYLINNADVKQEEIFSSFEVALSNPSSVVMDLLACEKKFIFINSLLCYQNLPNVYVDKLYSGYLTNLAELTDLLIRGVDDHDFKELRSRILGDSNLDVSLDNIIKSFKD